MRLETALYASREGLQAHGQAIAVVGDNIANANTTAFKESRIEFGDLMPDGEGGRQTSTIDAANGSTSGSGVSVAAVRTIFEDGVIEFTGRDLDIALDGNGFLITNSVTDSVYTRAGNLTIDKNGLLSTTDGSPVMGFQGTGTTLGPINMQDIATTSSPTSKITMTGNVYAVTPTGTALTNPQTFNELNLNPGTVLNTVSAYDSQGNSHDIVVAMTKTGTNKWVAQAFIDGGDVGGTAGVPKQIAPNKEITFEENGTISAANKAGAVLVATPAYSGGAAAGNFTIDFSGFTQNAGQNSIDNIARDGQGSGQVQGYNFAKDGTITAVLSSGSVVTVGKIQLADFANRDGLVRIGDGGYKATESAGDPILGNPTDNGLAGIQSGSLERSTVDIANQFVNLVVYQRGYQANSQTLSATNEMMRDTIALL